MKICDECGKLRLCRKVNPTITGKNRGIKIFVYHVTQFLVG